VLHLTGAAMLVSRDTKLLQRPRQVWLFVRPRRETRMGPWWLYLVAFAGPPAVLFWGVFAWGAAYLSWLRWRGRPLSRQQGEALSWAAACGLVFGGLAGVGALGWWLTSRP
jgi:hypothetical protein